MEQKIIKGYKAFNSDMTCRNFQYEVGKTYKHEGKIEFCSSGFHFCKELKDVYNYYSFDIETPICEVEAIGEVLDEGDKSVTSEIRIVRVLDLKEILHGINLMVASNSGSANSGSYNSGSDNRGSYNKGSYNKGSYNSDSANKGSHNSGSANSGSNNSGSYNKGSYNKGSHNRGSDNRGSDNRGSYNRGSYNSGSANSGSNNKGSYNSDSANKGSYNSGSANSGSHNSGSDNRGSGNKGSYNSGSHNSGSDNRGSDNRGSYNRGLLNFSSYNVGVFNYISFLGTNKNCYCFNEPTGMSMLEFAKKYLSILREIKKRDFTNVSELPNYTEEKWSLIRKHV